MTNKVPALITLGVDRQDLLKFDDKMQLGNDEFKISGVKISLNENQICGISFTYQNIKNGRKIICNDTCITGKNISQYEFEIGLNDYIQVLFGYYESGITQLGIITYKGQQAIFGKDQGYKFSYMFMGYTFTASSGSYKKGCLESLTFRVAKLPRDFLAQQFTPLLEIIYPDNPYENIVLTNFEQESQQQYEQQPQTVMQPVVSSEIIYSMKQNQTPQLQQGYPVQNQAVPPNQMPPYGNQYQQPNQYQTYQQYPNNQQYYSTPQQGANQVIVVNQQQQPQQQQQYYQKQGPGFAGTMARTALGTFAAIETVRMIENIGHHHHHSTNVVVVGNKHHGHHGHHGHHRR
ncbi:unnamed protein product [Paramecium primaurelia]|uniref:Jacalin-type lectin domain-containing protein n=1 Tax=Paramecium primaurelia TaxID=5886 RepID=A0A8S1LXY7_PARPR|nr:unnamed protein product [Paramecium primaurelia]